MHTRSSRICFLFSFFFLVYSYYMFLFMVVIIFNKVRSLFLSFSKKYLSMHTHALQKQTQILYIKICKELYHKKTNNKKIKNKKQKTFENYPFFHANFFLKICCVIHQ